MRSNTSMHFGGVLLVLLFTAMAIGVLMLLRGVAATALPDASAEKAFVESALGTDPEPVRVHLVRHAEYQALTDEELASLRSWRQHCAAREAEGEKADLDEYIAENQITDVITLHSAIDKGQANIELRDRVFNAHRTAMMAWRKRTMTRRRDWEAMSDDEREELAVRWRAAQATDGTAGP